MSAQSAFFGAMLSAEFGARYEDARGDLPDRPGFLSRPLTGVTTIAVHHTAGPQTATWRTVYEQHIGPRGFSGIGYHVGIRRGIVTYLGDVELARANVRDQNHVVIGVCIAGDYTRDALDPVDLDLLRRVVGIIDDFLGRRVRILGHGQVEGQATACPGPAVLAVLPTLRDGLADAPPAPRAPVLRDALRDGVAGRWLLDINPNAGLQRAIRADHFTVATDEWPATVGGVDYVCQGALGVERGKLVRRVYAVERGVWDAIRFVTV